MLTVDLLAFRQKLGRVTPRLLDPKGPAPLRAAQHLIGLFEGCVGLRRGELDAALKAAPADGLTGRTGDALAKLLLDRCTFETGAGPEPRVLRAQLFDAAAEAWRTHGAEGLPQWREALLARTGAPHGLSAAQTLAQLYGDLQEQQRLTALEPITPEALILRHNTAQVQGLLLWAERLEFSAPWPTPQRLRQLFGYLRFFGLLYEQHEDDGSGHLRLRLTGPLDLLESSTRYGLNLANFLPALLLWPDAWQLTAQVRLKRWKREAVLTLEPHAWLRSHYRDRGQWVPEEVQRFADTFNKRKTAWHCAPAAELVTLPGNRFLVPDFAFTLRNGPRKGGPRLLLEHLAWPDLARIRRTLEALRTTGRRDYLLACRDLPSLADLGEAPELLTYRRSLLPATVLPALAGRE